MIKRRKVFCGFWTTYIVDYVENKIIASGYNANGRLGNGSSYDSKVFVEVLLVLDKGDTIRKVCSCSSHVLVLTGNNRLYGWGRNSDAELFGHCLDVLRPTLIPRGDYGKSRIVDIQTAGFSSMIQTKDSWLLKGTFNNSVNKKFTPVKDPFPRFSSKETLLKVRLGWKVTYFLSNRGRVVNIGSNSHGQRGIGQGKKHADAKPIQVSNLFQNGHKVIDSFSFYEHTVLLTGGGLCFSMGNNSSGQLGVGHTKGSVYVPTQVRFSKESRNCKIVKVIVGFYHSAFIDELHVMYFCGSNSDSQVDPDHRQTGTYTIPTKLKTCSMNSKKFVDVVGGGYYNVFVCENGHLGVVGNNYFGASGTGIQKNKLSKIMQMKKNGNPIKIDMRDYDYGYLKVEDNEMQSKLVEKLLQSVLVDLIVRTIESSL